MSSKKKNAITMIALVVVLIICLVLYFVIPRGKSSDKDADSSSTSESNSTDSGSDNAKITLDTITSDNISSITLTKKGKQAWKLSQKKKGTWKIDGKESAPVSDDTISSMVKNVNPVKATQKFSAKSGNLSDYGLKTPAFTIAIETKDGASYQYQIGSEVPKSDMGYYAKCSGHDEIYCLNTAMITAFNVDEISFIKMDTLPEIDDDYLTAFSVKNKKGNDFAAKKVTDAEKVDFYSNWNITALLIKTAASKFLCQQFHIRSCTADMPSRIVITVLHQCCKPHHHLFIVFLEFRIERCLLIQINSHDHNRRNQTRQQCLREKHLICRHPDCH